MQDGMDHNDLIKRIHDEAMKAGMPPEIAAGIGQEWRDFDRRYGYRRFEAIFSVNRAVQFIQKLFKRRQNG